MIIMALAALILGIGALLTWVEARSARKDIEDTMLAQALMLGAIFDVDKIAGLTGTSADLTDSNYQYLRNQLIRIRNANSRYRYLYFFGRREGAAPFFFMGTAAENSADYSPPGQVYFEESPTLNRVFADRVPAVSPPFTDRWGTWVSALVPILDPASGRLLAVFGMDVDAGQWQNEIRRQALMPAMATGLTILLMGIGIGYWRRRQLAGHLVAQRQAQEALKQSETLFRLQFELGNIGIAITSPEKGWLRTNARLCQMLGYTENELRQKTWAEMTHPEDLAQDVAHFDRMLGGRIDGYEMDKRFFRKDGSIIDTHLTVACHRQEDGAVGFVIASLQDIGERKKADGALRDSERKYRLIAENAADIIFTMDTHFRFTYISPSVYRIKGFTPEEAMALSLGQMVPPKSLEKAQRAVASATDFLKREDFGTALTIELEQFRKDGSTFWTENEISFMLDESGKAIGIIGVTRDISKRKTAEKALQESQDRFRSLIQSAADMIFIIGADGAISYESPSAARILGYPEGFFIGQSPFDLIHPEDLDLVTREMDLVYRSVNSGQPTEFRLQKADGKWTWLEALANNQQDNPSIQGIVITARDVSERKRAEAEGEKLNAQLLQAQKMEAVGHLAGGIAHDFNNMLSVVIGHAEMAMIPLEPDGPMHKRLKAIHEAALRSSDLVRQLLAFARKQTVRPKVLDINDTIAGLLTMLRRLIGEDIDLVWAPGKNIATVCIDPSQVDQILANLMVNARDAIGGVGKVTIVTDNVLLDEAFRTDHAYCRPGRYVMLAFSDSGCGMDPPTMSRIFDPFFTTKAMGKGTGLGLATVYGIVKQNEGFIDVVSESGKGTTFRIYLPVASAPDNRVRAEEQIQGQVPAASERTGTVLIVEDDAVLLELGQSILARLGYFVLTAESPDQAIDIARTHQGRIDLLITDVVMPQMNGRQLVERLKEFLPGIKCLFMSGYTADIITHHGVLGEGVHFLQKPFSIAQIAAKVSEAMG